MRAIDGMAVTGLLVTLAASPLAAQRTPTFPTDDQTLRRIWQLGMDSSRVPSLAQAFLDSIGPRLTGTPEYGAAADWTIARYRDWGIEAARETYGTWRGWRRGTSHIDLVSPRVRSLEGTMLA
ncbi:MAG: peptidase M28, partial [Gemmatimonadales bacterium]|nr:peptidase M28 [Gemmatimonadales bacterium]